MILKVVIINVRIPFPLLLFIRAQRETDSKN
jgi:hypothetical protein